MVFGLNNWAIPDPLVDALLSLANEDDEIFTVQVPDGLTVDQCVAFIVEQAGPNGRVLADFEGLVTIARPKVLPNKYL